ncbi:hypothetical protein RND81_03G022100 [Saponaria officinalis]|uniref:DUF4371 domain-containing protein n=1 Tax=Saponaria officinalis TaxID=3572 RepID=A0AAW1M3T7_SAPOF
MHAQARTDRFTPCTDRRYRSSQVVSCHLLLEYRLDKSSASSSNVYSSECLSLQPPLLSSAYKIDASYINDETWLEYSKAKDATFCFACYFKTDSFDNHVGNHMSAHNNAMRDLDNFKKQKSSIIFSLDNQSAIIKSAYQTRLEASIKTARFLLRQGLSFRGHDEKETSLNKGNFIELLKLIAEHDEKIAKVVFDNAPQHCILTSPKIQKDIVNACATETTKKIVEELDEGRERFVGIMHVGDTTSLALKEAISQLLMKYSLTFSRVRGQGCDGASNMKGSINRLKTLILNESSSAYYVHCFAHQLQLILVAVTKKNHDCGWLFKTLTKLLNLVGISPKRKEILRERQAEHVLKELDLREIKSGSGLNQELGLSRTGDTRWHSHFKTILNVLTLYPTILDVIDIIGESSCGVDNVKAESLSYAMRRFDFIFVAQLMVNIFGVTNELNLAILVDVTNGSLQRMRDNGWDSHMKKVNGFCSKYDIDIPSMDDLYVIPGRHRRVEVFLSLIDQILHEFENRFDEVSKELLVCMTFFSPQDRFASFDTKKLLRLAKFFPSEFSEKELLFFEYQLDTFKYDLQEGERFWNLKSLNELSMKLVETMKHLTHSKVYLLLKIVLVLPVATATVERIFSAMTFIKNRFHNSMADQWLNDYLITFMERDVFLNVTVDEIVSEFKSMKTRRIV